MGRVHKLDGSPDDKLLNERTSFVLKICELLAALLSFRLGEFAFEYKPARH